MFERFRHRSCELERLDIGDYTADEYARWQSEMRVIHRMFGEVRALRRSLKREIQAGESRQISILDVGAGSGNIIKEVRKWTRGRKAVLVGAEMNSFAVETIRNNSIHAVRCDALKLPFSRSSFDYVICSLFVHHLNDESVVEFLTEMRRVARKRVYVVDLHRSPVAYYFYRVVARILFQRLTREDGALSILRSFKPDELRSLAERAGLNDIQVVRSASYRLVLSGY